MRDFAHFGRSAGHCADRELELQDARGISRKRVVQRVHSSRQPRELLSAARVAAPSREKTARKTRVGPASQKLKKR